jgi:hypothetical protein
MQWVYFIIVLAMNGNMAILATCGVVMLTLTGCCGLSDYEDGSYYGSDAETDLFASEAADYEGSDCWGSAGCAGVDDGTYSYEDYSSGSYEYYEQ